MTTTTFALVAIGFATCVWAWWGLIPALVARRNLAGVRLVTCPETGEVAAVGFDRLHAAFTALVHHKPDVRLGRCSRWAVRGPCDHACVPQAAVPDSAVTNIIAHWSQGRNCALCHNPLNEAPRLGHHIALLASDGVTSEWPDVPPETLPGTLRTRQPVCWDCHVVETFRRKYPELVTDR